MPSFAIPAAVPIAPYHPSPVESQCYYYGIPSRPLLVARSSLDVWLEPTGPEAYLLPKESSPIGLHPLRDIWEATVGPAIVDYLGSKEVEWTSLDPVRMGFSGVSSPPVIVWMGVVPGSLSAEEGIEVAVYCKGILSAHNINDVHVEIRESEVFRSAGPKLYKPIHNYNATAQAREPFSSALGLPICAEATPFIEGTGGFFISLNPGEIYLVTARHVIFDPDEEPNVLYRHRNSTQPRRNVLLLGDAAVQKHVKATESEIGGKHIIIELLEGRLEDVNRMDDEEDAEGLQNDIMLDLERAKKVSQNSREVPCGCLERLDETGGPYPWLRCSVPPNRYRSRGGRVYGGLGSGQGRRFKTRRDQLRRKRHRPRNYHPR